MDPQIVTNFTLAEWKEALTQIPTLSIVTEMRHLFDATTGIYANASGHGEIWERPVSLELLNPTNAVVGRFQENCGLRIRGGASRGSDFRKHSFRVFFRREYGAGKLNYPLFEDDGAQEFETFDLRTSQNYSWPRNDNNTWETMVREVWCRQTLGAMGQPYRRSRYYHLYLNGQYWGLYETDERPEASYGQTYFGGSKTNYDVVKCGNRGVTPTFATEMTDGNFSAWSNLWVMCQAMRTNASTSNYFRPLGRNPDGTRNTNLPVLLDVDNLIDYMIEIFYAGDGDATLSSFLGNNMPNNWFGMRDRTNPEVGFRFFNSDCEHTLGSPNSQVDRTGPFGGSNEGNFLFSNPQWMHEELMRNSEYRLRFADHVQRHFFNNGALTFENCTNRYMTKMFQINKAIRAYSARWGDAVQEPPRTERDWLAAVNWPLTNWFGPRAGIVLGQLRADGLFPTVGAPTFSRFGGSVPAGFNLEIIQTNLNGTLYYTTDGSDPRQVGGAVAVPALAYAGVIPINADTTVRARVLVGTNWSPIIDHRFFPPQDLSGLRVTEILYNPPADGSVDGDEFEFLELKNTGGAGLNLGGLRFTAGITFAFTNGTVLPPGGFFVLVRNPARFAARYPGREFHGVYSGRLDNAGETLTLSHPLGTRVFSVTYDDAAPWPLTADGTGFSLVPVLPNPNPDPDQPAHWRASTARGGSPGDDDPPAAVLPVLVNEVLSHSEVGGDFIELFNPNAVPALVGGWFLTDAAGDPRKYRIPDGVVIDALGYVVFDETQFNPTPGTNQSFALGARGDDVYLFSGDAGTNLTGFSHGFSFGAGPDGATFGRYVISTGEEQFPLQAAVTRGQPNAGPAPAPVVLSEIQYHPSAGGDEFIELRNVSGGTVAFFDGLRPTNRWRLNGVDFSFPAGASVPSDGVVLLVPVDPGSFRAAYGVPDAVQIFGPYAGNLQDSGERLELHRPDVPDTNGLAYITVDEVRYNDRAPWPAAADGSGASLQRRALAAYGNDPANWEAAVPTPGEGFVAGVAPSITAQPLSQTTLAGRTVTFSVAATGPGSLSYQWRYDGGVLPGATQSTLVLSNVSLAAAGTYSVVVFSASGSAASAPAVLSVLRPPRIVFPPTNQLVRVTSNAVFTVAAAGNGILRYQWHYNGADIPGATNISLVVSNVQLSSAGAFAVTVTDSVGPATSTPARLIVLIDPIIVVQPVPVQIGVPGGSASFSVTVTNTATLPIAYRWRRGGVTVFSNSVSSHIGVFTTNGLSTTGRYDVVVLNLARPAGLISSNAFLLLVSDRDGDLIPDAVELELGLNPDLAGDAAADPDGDRMSTYEEYVAGTDPFDRTSYLRVDPASGDGGRRLEFLARSNRTYTIEFAEDLGGPPAAATWSKLADVVAREQTRPETITDTNRAVGTRFYRLVTPGQTR